MARSTPDPRTPWNKPVIERLFWTELGLAILVTLLLIPVCFLGNFYIALWIPAISITAIISSATHLFVIRHNRPIVLGAVVGVNVLWACTWLAMTTVSMAFSALVLVDGVGESGGRTELKPALRGMTAILLFVCLLSLAMSITICVFTIRALKREKKGYIADEEGYAIASKRFGMKIQKYVLKNGVELGKFANVEG